MKTYLHHGENTLSRPRNTKGKREMRSKLSTLGLVLMVSAVIFTGFAATPIHAASTGTHIVQPGDTMMAIAARHGVSVSELAGDNGLSWDSWVYAGQRLTIPDATQQAVDSWTGRITNLPFGSQHTHYFERSDGRQFGIGAMDDALDSRIDELRWSGKTFRVWGTLRTDVPSYAGQYIAVEWVEIVSEAGTETRNLTPLATVSASSHLRTDRWGQYQPWMAVDGASETAWVEGVAGPGTGQWVMLSFPGTVEVHSVGLDVGYDNNADIFTKNNRIKRATLIFSNGDQVELGFGDKRGIQTIRLARAPGPSIRTTSIKVVLKEVFPGWKYDDTCLSEVEVWGRTD
jgi:LysM repeat protein